MSQSSTQNSTPSFKKQVIFALGAVVAIALILGLIKYFQITKAIAANRFTPTRGCNIDYYNCYFVEQSAQCS